MIKKNISIFFLSLALVSGCGYSTRSLLPGSYQNLFVEPIKNNVTYTTERQRNIYLPLLEVKVRNAIVNRYIFDGNLNIANNAETADLVLKGELNGFEREVLRYTENNDVQEYRIRITISLALIDTGTGKPVWEEPGFVGETTYFPVGSQAKSESAAVEDALLDLSRRVVERTIEDW